MQALPQWSQQALQQHTGDPREVKTLEQLENGQTRDAIWDAMQQQLKKHGAALPHLLLQFLSRDALYELPKMKA